MLWGEFRDAATRRLRAKGLAGDIAGFLNDVQSKMARETRWLHLNKAFQSRTVAPKVVTATLVQDSAIVTIAGATPDATWVGQIFKVDDEGPYYEISALVPSQPTQIELVVPYIEANGAKASKIIFFQLALPATWASPHIAHVNLLSGTSEGTPLIPGTQEDIFRWQFNEASPTGTPSRYRIDGGKLQLSPPPDATYMLRLFLGRQPTPMDPEADEATELDWPSDYHDVLLDGVLEIGFADTNDDLFVFYGSRFRTGLLSAVAQNNTPPGVAGQRMGRCDATGYTDEGTLPEVI